MLSQLSSFLPKMKAANESIKNISEKERESLNIENVDDCDKVLEMVCDFMTYEIVF